MRLSHKITSLALVSLVAVLLAMGALVTVEARDLETKEVALLEEAMLASKRAELQHYVSLALTSIADLQQGPDEPAARERARRILSGMNYGDDGYFFAYDFAGNNLVHPRQPELVGQNLWELKDDQGLPVIQKLLEVARAGGGYQRYRWRKPSTGQLTDKLGYVVTLDRWGWMMGTGIYLDDVAASTERLREELAAHIRLTMIGLALVAVVATVMVFVTSMALNIREHRLADQRLKALAQRIVSLQEEERAHVSRELHDGLSQLLVSTKYHVELGLDRARAGRGDALGELGAGLTGLTEAIGEVRRISHGLRPALLDDLGLPAAITMLADEFARRTGVAVSTAVEPVGPGVSADGLTTLFRIAQEALTNVERHAGAARVEVALAGDAEAVRLSIADDGRGFEPRRIDHPRSQGIGLRNMRERIEHLGGELVLASAPGRTQLTAVLPVLEGRRAAT